MLYLLHGETRSVAGGPSSGLLLTEPLRGLADLAALVAAPGLLAAPRGNGHAVLISPGLLAGHSSTGPLRAFLRWLGYDARGWDLGRNHGPSEGWCSSTRPYRRPGRSRTGRWGASSCCTRCPASASFMAGR